MDLNGMEIEMPDEDEEPTFAEMGFRYLVENYAPPTAFSTSRDPKADSKKTSEELDRDKMIDLWMQL